MSSNDDIDEHDRCNDFACCSEQFLVTNETNNIRMIDMIEDTFKDEIEDVEENDVNSLIIITPYEYGKARRVWIFDPITYTFTKMGRTATGRRPPEDNLAENEPTAMDIKDYTMMTHHMCVVTVPGINIA